jgi:hypothetical protein
MTYYRYNKSREFNVLLGKTLSSIKNNGNELIFECTDGTKYIQFHQQDCCESVGIEDIEGDLQSLIGNPLLVAEESQPDFPGKSEVYGENSYADESYTWTFYKLATINGHVDIRWYGSSNGYYSESVNFYETTNA